MLSSEISSESRVLGLVAWLLILVGPIAAVLVRPNDEFVKFHSFQSLILSVCVIVCHVALTVISQVPLLWVFLKPLYSLVDSLIYTIWLIVALVCGVKMYFG